jgi:uncharacterized protein YbbC (DUF1343 family)
MTWKDTRLRWVPTSPNIPKGYSALYYVSTGLLGPIGGINTGVTFGMPFECATAPWINAQKFSRQLQSYNLKGIEFIPFSIKQNDYTQNGVRLSFTDPAHAPLLPVTFYILDAVRKLYHRELYADAVKRNKDFALFDKVCGSDFIRKALDAHWSAQKIVSTWKYGEDSFKKRRQKYLLYSVEPTPAPFISRPNYPPNSRLKANPVRRPVAEARTRMSKPKQP